MATTRIIPMHLNKGKTLAQCLADRTEYGMNPDKTEGGALISAFACEPETAVSEFALSKREYRELTGRVQESDVIAYQVRQSFKPGEVTPEEANRIGYEFAKRFLKGRHAFLVCTHTDKNTFTTTSTKMDRILCFCDGTLIEDGSHEELLKQNGYYSQLYRLSTEKYIMDIEDD